VTDGEQYPSVGCTCKPAVVPTRAGQDRAEADYAPVKANNGVISNDSASYCIGWLAGWAK